MYIREYEAEVGTPWKNLDAYLRNPYPLPYLEICVRSTKGHSDAKVAHVPTAVRNLSV